ncbi:cupin domain-containing protein [Sphingopyxis sp.]|uniref:cupin domain-containing protein n=1 Tax=Sphingopyxis sp. TaxID=1908224 RepID=UPI002B47658B|nr:cupin domain-containing protein [Sphingopyxis sp.]HJS09770.1 cupin domain-containing protein [Sphingopyxis sp.]
MVRRVVAGHRGGKAVFLSDGQPAGVQKFQAMPGMMTAPIWETGPTAAVSSNDAIVPPGETSFLPAPGETRFLYLQVAPQSVMMNPDFDPVAAQEEMLRLQPEMAALMEADAPGMHRTESIDYVIVLDGEIYIELDDGAEILLRQHDTIIQIGTRHAWHNRSDRPVLLAVVLVGALRG